MAVTPNSIVTPQAVKSGYAMATTAKTVFTDTSNLVLLYTAGSNGGLLKEVVASTLATTSAAVKLMLYSSKDGLTTAQAFSSVLYPAYTQSANTATPVTPFAEITEIAPKRLVAGEAVYAAIGVAGNMQFRAGGEDY